MSGLDPAVGAALVAGVVSIVVAVISLFATKATIDAAARDTAQKLAQAAKDNQAKLDQETQRLRSEFALEFAAETAVRTLLMDERWPKRSFMIIKSHLGGFADDELRKLLVRAGAVRFTWKSQEYWGLLDRNRAALGPTGQLSDPDAQLLAEQPMGSAEP
jgi:hypothetical protein